MSHELVYTSAPQGLKPGSRGFCTVVTTANMARNLMERLESFSGYRHAFMVHEAGAAQNPINYTHYHTAIGGRKYHVLSRIADAGLDYTQRSNKLAHHVALEPGETAAAPGGPAWVMAAPGFFVDQWDGQVRTLAAGSQPTPSDRPPKVCRLWKQLIGDAGWAGVLAESALGQGSPMSVIFPAGTPTLELVVEALALLPPERRWQVTFSTYFTKAPAGVDCQWRFVLDGTPEAASLRRDARAAVIDLCRPLERAQGAELVEAARTGVTPRRMAVRAAAPLSRPVTGTQRPTPAAVASDDEADELTLAPLSPPSPARRSAVPPPWQTAKRPKSTLYLLPIAVVGLLILALGLALGAFWVNTQRYLTERARPDLSVKRTSEALEIPDESVDEEESGDETQDDTEAAEQDVSTKDEIVESAALDGAPEPQTKTTTEEASTDPFRDIRKRGNRLTLPHALLVTTEPPNRAPKLLAELDVKSSSDVELQLIGSEFEPRQHQKNTIRVSGQDGIRRWEVVAEGMQGPDGVPVQKVGTFFLQDGKLKFNWERNSWQEDPPPLRLAFCQLELRAYEQTISCVLEVPTKLISSAQLAFTRSIPITLLRSEEYYLRPNDYLKVDCKLRGVEGDDTIPEKFLTLENKKPVSISLPVPPYHPDAADTKVSLELSLRHTGQGPVQIAYKLVAIATELQQQEAAVGDNAPPRLSWKPVPVSIELTEENIKKYSEGFTRDFDGKHRGFPLTNWRTKELPEIREIAVQYAQLQADLNSLSDPFHGSAQERVSTLRSQIDSIAREHPDVVRAYKGYKLSVPYRLEAAKEANAILLATEVANAWCEAMKEVLSKQLKLDYRLHIEIDDGREIDLVKTEGFQRPQAEPKTTQ